MSVTGLSPRAVVRQSYLCHPDWSAEVHRSFLLHDADECFEPWEVPATSVIESWLAVLRRGASRLLPGGGP